MKTSVAFLAAFLFWGVGFSGQVGAAKQTFLLDWIIYGKHAPFFVAQDKGFFKKVGLDVDFKRGFGSGDTIRKVGAKAALLGFADASTLVNARANSDVPVKEVAIIHAKSLEIVGFLKEKGYKTPKDLVGQRYGNPPTNRCCFPALAGANGFPPDSIKEVGMEIGSLVPSLLAGKVDFIALFATELPTLRAKAASIGKEVGAFYFADWGVDAYNNGVVVHEDSIRSNPQFVRNAVRAVVDAWAWSIVNVDETVKNFLKYAPGMSEPLIRGHLAIAVNHLFDEGVRRHGLGYMDHQKMDATVDMLTKYQGLKKRIRAEDMYTNRFLPQWPAIKAALGDKAR
ncbi:MAG: ABC transporter substrate-binding protein [Nitrospinota bacterium]